MTFKQAMAKAKKTGCGWRRNDNDPSYPAAEYADWFALDYECKIQQYPSLPQRKDMPGRPKASEMRTFTHSGLLVDAEDLLADDWETFEFPAGWFEQNHTWRGAKVEAKRQAEWEAEQKRLEPARRRAMVEAMSQAYAETIAKGAKP